MAKHRSDKAYRMRLIEDLRIINTLLENQKYSNNTEYAELLQVHEIITGKLERWTNYCREYQIKYRRRKRGL